MWQMFCKEIFETAIHVDFTLIHATYLIIVQTNYNLIKTVFRYGSGLSKQNNTAAVIKGWFEVQGVDLLSLIICGIAVTPPLQTPGFQGSAVDVLVSDITAHL